MTVVFYLGESKQVKVVPWARRSALASVPPFPAPFPLALTRLAGLVPPCPVVLVRDPGFGFDKYGDICHVPNSRTCLA